MEGPNITSKGQVTIPIKIRRALGIRQGSKVAFALNNGKVELRVVHRASEALVSDFGMLGARGMRLPADFDAASLPVPQTRPMRGKR